LAKSDKNSISFGSSNSDSFFQYFEQFERFRARKMITLFCLVSCLVAGSQEEPAKTVNPVSGAVFSANQLPTAQEKLLARLLAEQPEDRRGELIAQALANSRLEAREASQSTSPPSSSVATPMVLESGTNKQLDLIRDQQQLLALELKNLRAESKLLKERFDSLMRKPEREPANSTQGLSQTFVLPRFQRPGLPQLSGPFVNQPSGPMIVLPPAPESETEQAITLELAQLSRDMFRLNQRLQQLQGSPERPASPMVLNQPSKEPAEQAKRPSPLLPR
jgi:hypothetical protein